MTYSATRHPLVSAIPTRPDSIHQYLPPTPPTRQPSQSYNEYWIATQQSQQALLQQSQIACHDYANTTHKTLSAVNTSLPPATWYQEAPLAASFDSRAADFQPVWSMYTGQIYNSMGGLATPTQQHQGLKRAGSHQRTPSASTVGSIGPPSPYQYNTAFPQVANSEYGSNSPASSVWDLSASSQLSKNLAATSDSHWASDSGYLPSQAAHMPAPHLAMKGFAIDHHNLEDMPSEYHQLSRQSSSSIGHDSPATPKSSADDADSKPPKSSPNGEIALWLTKDDDDCLLSVATDYRQPNPEVQLQRTESAAYQDELYNPANFVAAATSSAARPANNFLSPHRSLVNERLQTANIARSVSPTSAMSRERSPFRQGSPLAPVNENWRHGMGTAASMRQQQKEEGERVEYAQHQPALRREATKTISPKDALLDYNDSDQPSLFQDNIPEGYKQHFGNADPNFQSFFSQDSSTFEGVPTTSQQSMPNFRATSGSADGYSGGNMGNFGNFPPPNMQASSQIHAPFQTGNYQQVNNMNTSYPSAHVTEPTPDFPAHLTSMESSMSDGQMPSSQEHDSSNAYSTIQRPVDTRANTGTYTCTYHGCTERFGSQPDLQRHKRDNHRSQAHANKESEASSGSASVEGSPRSSVSPAPSASGMTSAALLARNSQAGPHKCSRVNPSTGKPCNTVFSRPYDLTRHEDTIHNNRKMKVRCPYCREEKTFSRNDALTRHMRVVHPDVESFGKRGRRAE